MNEGLILSLNKTNEAKISTNFNKEKNGSSLPNSS